MNDIIPSAQSFAISALLEGYRHQRFTPRDVIAGVQERIATQPNHNSWITRLSPQQLEPYLAALEGVLPDALPLYGIPFAIKDNIDLAGVPTTAGCSDYAYQPDQSAFVVQRLIDAGAIPVGKTNLDQFATGLVGTRSPYGPGKNSFNPEYISGGSSSGSSVAVAMGQVSFALGTDTAGSGRVPAAFNNLVGVKPTRGLLSNRGVVPACRTLDCISIFALTNGDAERVLKVSAVFDAQDAWARPAPDCLPSFPVATFTFGVPREEQLEFFGNKDYEQLFRAAVQRLETLGGIRVEIDFEPFLEAARLLYEGPWVAERYAAIEEFISAQPDAMHPVTRQIIAGGATPTAVACFKAQYRLAECKRLSEAFWPQLDVIVTPTAGTVYRIDAVEADPVRLNSSLGYYTNFMNLLDLAAVAAPAGFAPDGLPFGITFIAPAFSDSSLLALADRFHGSQALKQGATAHVVPQATCAVRYAPPGTVPIAVCGAHLSGLPLNGQLSERGALLLESTRTASCYRLYVLAGGPPHRPGLIRSDTGSTIEVEVWALPADTVGSFLEGIPAPLGLGKLELADGRQVSGFICEGCGVEGAEDITRFGGWRAYVAQRS
jgi:allophanate hydrolase